MAITIATLKAAQGGDHEAGQVLMTELYQPVYHFLFKRTGNQTEADELCQTVFLKVFEKIDSFDASKASVVTWVFAITRNTLIDHFRRPRPVLVGELPDLAASDLTSQTDGLAEQRSDAAYVASLLKKLPEEVADVVTLRAIEEMSYESIAEIIGKTPEATRQIYSRALTTLKELVREAG